MSLTALHARKTRKLNEPRNHCLVTRKFANHAEEYLYRAPRLYRFDGECKWRFITCLLRSLLLNPQLQTKVRNLSLRVPPLDSSWLVDIDITHTAQIELRLIPMTTTKWESDLLEVRVEAWIGLLLCLTPKIESLALYFSRAREDRTFRYPSLQLQHLFPGLGKDPQTNLVSTIGLQSLRTLGGP